MVFCCSPSLLWQASGPHMQGAFQKIRCVPDHTLGQYCIALAVLCSAQSAYPTHLYRRLQGMPGT